jgi:hypothetical protein
LLSARSRPEKRREKRLQRKYTPAERGERRAYSEVRNSHE